MADLGELERMMYGNVEDDAELEAELMALEAEELQKAESPQRKPPPPAPRRGVNFDQIGRLAKQISQEAVIKDDEDDPSVENEPDLLAELDDILGDGGAEEVVAPEEEDKKQPDGAEIALIQSRLELYQKAASQAEAEQNTTKLRRLQRGVKTLQELLRKAKQGQSINEEDIPPIVSLSPRQPIEEARPVVRGPEVHQPEPEIQSQEDHRAQILSEARHKPPVPDRNPSGEDGKALDMLVRRGKEYKSAAAAAKGAGDRAGAVRNMKIAMQFDQVIEAMKAGQEVDLSQVPPSPPPFTPSSPVAEQSKPSPPPQKPKPTPVAMPKTVLEALEQRLEFYKSAEAKAKENNDSRKARMMGRIIGQYKGAIAATKAGRKAELEELPVPPGYPPFPGAKEEPAPTPTTPEKAPEKRAGPPSAQGPTPPKLSKHEEQVQFLLTRQLQFKQAALFCKKKGDVNGAKKYLVHAKGFDQMIEAAKAGLPVDISKSPIPPQLHTGTAALKAQVSVSNEAQVGGSSVISGTREEVFGTLEKDLIKQVQVSEQNQEYFTRLGDIGRVKKFEESATANRKDLLNLRAAFKAGDPPPRFRYELRAFPALKTNPDLGEEELEIGIVRGIQVKLPSGYKEEDADLFVRYEFPFPQESPRVGKTESVKNTSSPSWNEKFKLPINPKSRQMLRALKRHGVKFEVFQKGGFLRSHKLVGTAEVKLGCLEEQSSLHDSFYLTEGRKPIGGKLEVKIRIREPFVSKAPEIIKEKWLVIDEFAKVSRPKVPKKPPHH